MGLNDFFGLLSGADKVKKIILIVSASLFGLLVVLDVVLGLLGFTIPGRVSAIGELVKILSAIVAIITAKVSK